MCVNDQACMSFIPLLFLYFRTLESIRTDPVMTSWPCSRDPTLNKFKTLLRLRGNPYERYGDLKGKWELLLLYPLTNLPIPSALFPPPEVAVAKLMPLAPLLFGVGNI